MMLSFATLSVLSRAVLALWALLLCLINIGSAVLATVKRRYPLSALAVLLFVPCYGMWQVIFDIYLSHGSVKIATLSAMAGNLPRLYWLAAFLLFTAAAAALLAYNIRYDMTFITPGTIKLYLDKMPCGICCWRENGQVLFSNICMNNLCKTVTGKPLLNGNVLRDAVQEDILTVDNTVWHFRCREIETNGERLWEMIASDITAEYAKTAALECDKAELSRLNQDLRDYYLSIDESVHRQEVLQAKMNIHDEMNRLMLSTIAADKDDTEALDRTFSMWEQNALLLCMDADSKNHEPQTKTAESLAGALGIELIWHDELPTDMTQKHRELFFFTLQEAMINAVKHAAAKKMEVFLEESETALTCRFCNDGTLPQHQVRFAGGLANLSRLAEKQGATLAVEINNNFTLVLQYPPNG